MKLSTLVEKATQAKQKTVAVAAAEDREVIEAVAMALEANLAAFQLYGNEKEIHALLIERGVDIDNEEDLTIIPASTGKEAAQLAVQAVNDKRADAVMKGMIPTSVILKAVLNKEWGLRTGSVLSHVAAFEIPDYDRLIFVTDAAMNIKPTLEEKAQIIRNSVQVARALGLEKPKVAPITAVEVVNPNMEATLDAAALAQMSNRGQITDCIVDGPLALDNAISPKAAEHKGVGGEVAGQADILLVPAIETGNVLYKSLMYFAKAKVGAVIAGAKAPIVLTSRADSAESKLYSLALAVCSAKN
ncbi:phosphate butyryltransferase [Bacillus solimangrovi]|uniref:Phosphate butyryltransferase n=1 Tax=Bacillus solimangrovi TaxID=1305675 RepID=A0A1E5LKE6_9BACI|nr:phosphate butyryltransferase [Bacillus solimangrovi]OEH94506.1 phosphate butyryltransferase [Bacillus solimangrovi]